MVRPVIRVESLHVTYISPFERVNMASRSGAVSIAWHDGFVEVVDWETR